MADSDRARWDARYRERGEAPCEPSPSLVALERFLPRRGHALDVAGGAGRNALWLARRGLDVMLLDISPVALEHAQRQADAEGLRLATCVLDVEAELLPPGPWDLVVCTDFLWRPLFEAVPRVLAAGGTLVVIHPTRTNLERNARPSARYLLDDGELPGLVRGLSVVFYEEGWNHGAHEARLVAIRTAQESDRPASSAAAEQGEAAVRGPAIAPAVSDDGGRA